MKKLTTLLMLCFLFIFSACRDSYRAIYIGNDKYNIPVEYLLSDPSFYVKGLDNYVSLVSVTFDDDIDFYSYKAKNGWLPNTPIISTLYSYGSMEYAGIHSNRPEGSVFEIDGLNVIKLDRVFRVFRNNENTNWHALPVEGAILGSNDIRASWVASCFALGGQKGTELSRDEFNIPTSCKVDILYRDNILTISTSELNIVNNFDEISNLIVNKFDLWRE